MPRARPPLFGVIDHLVTYLYRLILDERFRRRELCGGARNANGRSASPGHRETDLSAPAMADQFLTVMQEMSERFSVRHTASASSRSRPAKRARNNFFSPLATTGSVNGSALPSMPRA